MKGLKKLYASIFTFVVVCLCMAQNALAAIELPETIDLTAMESIAGGLVIALVGILGARWVFGLIKKA